MFTENDKKLINQAKALVGAKKVRGGTLKEVACVLVTEKGNVYEGVCMDLYCGIGFCAEHTAIATMITNSDETHIKTIVAVNDKTAIPPCGRCRELLSLIDEKNLETEVIISEDKKVKLKELLPSAWQC